MGIFPLPGVALLYLALLRCAWLLRATTTGTDGSRKRLTAPDFCQRLRHNSRRYLVFERAPRDMKTLPLDPLAPLLTPHPSSMKLESTVTLRRFLTILLEPLFAKGSWQKPKKSEFYWQIINNRSSGGISADSKTSVSCIGISFPSITLPIPPGQRTTHKHS